MEIKKVSVDYCLRNSEEFIGKRIALEGWLLASFDTPQMATDNRGHGGNITICDENFMDRMLPEVLPLAGGRYVYCHESILTGIIRSTENEICISDISFSINFFPELNSNRIEVDFSKPPPSGMRKVT